MSEEKKVEIPFEKMRPQGLPKLAWAEIINSWTNGLSDREAAFRASRECGRLIKESEIKEIVAADENIGMLRDHLHADIISEAKLNIKESIMEGNISTSKWYLERRQPEEFSTKAASFFEGAVVELSIDERKKQMEEFMDQFTNKPEGGSDDKQGT